MREGNKNGKKDGTMQSPNDYDRTRDRLRWWETSALAALCGAYLMINGVAIVISPITRLLYARYAKPAR